MDFGKPFATVRRKSRVLDFDIETRPLAVWYDGKCTWEPTAIAWAWDGGRVAVHAIPETDTVSMLLAWREQFDIAVAERAILTGHNIRDFDLPVLQAAMIENGLPPLVPCLTSDTLRDLPKMKDMSKSQENLGIMFGLRNPKAHMANADWREANRMTADGIERTCARVTADVKQHRELRATLIARGLLAPPRIWRP